ncbi:MAG: PRC-barrel domain-containing protein [Ilumatobacteraceae bacterium]
MSTSDNMKVDDWMHRTVIDTTGNKVGTVTDIYLDEETKQPDWLAVSTGLFGTKVSFVPIDGARLDGDDLVVAYDKDTVKDAPRIDADGMLSVEDEQSLYTYYGRAYTPHTGSDAPVGTADTRATTPPSAAPVSMVRSEEELSIGTHSREAGRVKLRKWVETETVTEQVPVNETVRKERVDVDGDIDGKSDRAAR